MCSTLFLGAPWLCSASCLTALPPCCITYKSSSSTCKGYLHLFLPPHPKLSGLLPHPTPAHSTPTLCLYCYYCYYHSLHQHSPLPLLLREALSCLPLCCLKTAGPPPAPFEHKDQCHLWNDECKYLQWDSNFTLLAFLKISCIFIPHLLSSH